MRTPLYQLKRTSRIVLTGNFGIPVRAMLLAQFLPLLLEYPFALTLGSDPSDLLSNTLYYISVFLLGIFGELLMIGRSLIHLAMLRREPVSPSLVFYCLKNSSNHYAAGAIFLQVISFVISFPLSVIMTRLDPANPDPALYRVFFLILAVTLAFRLVYRAVFGLFHYILLDFEEDSLKENLTLLLSSFKGNFLRLIKLQFSFLALQFLGLISFGVALIWIDPYIEQTFAVYYQDTLSQLPSKTKAQTQIPSDR